MSSQSRKEEKKRAEIIQATYQMCCTKGIDATEMSDIADSVDISRSTLYRYYNNKADLLKVVYQYNLDRILGLFPKWQDQMNGYNLKS